MASDRIMAALGRIERALETIEQAPPPPSQAPFPRREQAAEALRSLDSLIADLRLAQNRQHEEDAAIRKEQADG